ncbi:MAG: hypothetical protein ACTHZ5_06245 [Micrococcaceae bacterium]
MLYLLDADGSVYQNSMSVGRALVRRKIERKSLDTVQWEPAPETVTTERVLRAALRFGIPTGRGLIVAAGYVRTLEAPDLLGDGRDQQRALTEQLETLPEPSAQFGASRSDAYQARLSRLSEQRSAAESKMSSSFERAQTQRNELLQSPIQDALAEHWASLAKAGVVDPS